MRSRGQRTNIGTPNVHVTGSVDARSHLYRVSGLLVDSEFELPELMPVSDATDEPDVIIRRGAVPDQLPGAAQPMAGTQVTDSEVLLKIRGVGRYRVCCGNRITVAPEPGVLGQDLRLFLLGSAMGAIYLQRGLFPLHASVVVMGGQGIGFTGDSGAGKSTMAAWLNSHGFPLLCDDVCAIQFDAEGAPMAQPSFPRVKLWKDALAAIGIDSAHLQPDYSRADKYHAPVTGGFASAAVPLRHVFALAFGPDNEPPSVQRISPAQSVHLLRDNTYRYQYISDLKLTRSHFLDCVRLAEGTKVWKLTRPRRHSALPECRKVIEQQIR